ncbi:MAVS protein, partial [Atractosteus spatula]|nr:MAVS protein [Atractosteus spatula]
MTLAGDKLYNDYLRRNMARYVSKVKVMNILPHLSCLTDSDKEEITAKRESAGNYIAMQLLVDCLRRREDWHVFFINALEEDNHPSLAKELRDEYESLQASNCGRVAPPPQRSAATAPEDTSQAPVAHSDTPAQPDQPSVPSHPLPVPVQLPASRSEEPSLPSAPAEVRPPVKDSLSPVPEMGTPARSSSAAEMYELHTNLTQGTPGLVTPQVKTRPAAIDATTIPLFPSSTGASANPHDGEFLSKPGTLHSFVHAQVLHAANDQVDHPPIPEEPFSVHSHHLERSSGHISCSDCNQSAGAPGNVSIKEPPHNEPEENHFSSFEDKNLTINPQVFQGGVPPLCMPQEPEVPWKNGSENALWLDNDLEERSPVSDVRENEVHLSQVTFGDNYAGHISHTSLERSPESLRGTSESQELEKSVFPQTQAHESHLGDWGHSARDLLGNYYVQAAGVAALSTLVVWGFMRK